MWISLLCALALAEPAQPEAPAPAEEVPSESEASPEVSPEDASDTPDSPDGAQDPEQAEDPKVPDAPLIFELPSIEDLPSALDDDRPIETETSEELTAVLRSFSQERRGVWGASNYVRPSLSMLFTEQVHPMQLGVQAGRRWWQLGEGVRPSFALATAADFPLAQGGGSVDWTLAALGGPWLKHVGLHLGPGVGWSRWTLGPEELPGAWAVDGHASLVLDLRKVVFSVGYSPRWLVSGERDAAPESLLLGDEQVVRAGVGVSLGVLRLGTELSRRWTAIGTLDRVGLSMRLRL